MPALAEHLRRQADQSKSAMYFNIDILKYNVRSAARDRITPLQLVSHWKSDERRADFRLDYQYNAAIMPTRLPLHNVTVLLPVATSVTNMQSQPQAVW